MNWEQFWQAMISGGVVAAVAGGVVRYYLGRLQASLERQQSKIDSLETWRKEQAEKRIETLEKGFQGCREQRGTQIAQLERDGKTLWKQVESAVEQLKRVNLGALGEKMDGMRALFEDRFQVLNSRMVGFDTKLDANGTLTTRLAERMTALREDQERTSRRISHLHPTGD